MTAGGTGSPWEGVGPPPDDKPTCDCDSSPLHLMACSIHDTDQPTVSEKAEWDRMLTTALSEQDYEIVRAAVQRALDERCGCCRKGCPYDEADCSCAADVRARGNDGD